MRLSIVPIAAALAACAPADRDALGDASAGDAAMVSNVAVGEVRFDPALAHARALAAGRIGVCDFAAYSTASDPRGTEVRAGPSPAARLLGRLPPLQHDAELDGDYGPDIAVLAAANGWFRIRYDEGRPPLTGWIEGRHLGFDLQTDLARAAPRTDAPVVATTWTDAEGLHPLRWRAPSDCKGKWIKLRVAGRDGHEQTGWAAGICASQDTSCDGVEGEMLPRR